MHQRPQDLEQRIAFLETALRRAKLAGLVLALLLVVGASAAFVSGQPQTTNEVRTRRLVIVDDKDQMRVMLGQDPAATQRISRAAGLVLYDEKGNERGGFATMADGSVVIGMDAPVGVGTSPMRDRIGLKVHPDGSAYVMVIDNKTNAVARLISEDGASGARGVQVFKWEPDGSKYQVRTVTADGDTRNTVSR